MDFFLKEKDPLIMTLIAKATIEYMIAPKNMIPIMINLPS